MDPTVVQRESEFWEAHESFDWLTEAAVESVIAGIPTVSGDVLELCSGSGMFTRKMPRTGSSYTCLDLSEALLRGLREAVPGVRTLQGNAMEPELPDESFDYVCVFAGLHHLPDTALTLRSACRLLRPGGRFVCFEPNDRCWYRQPMKLMRNLIGFYSEDEVFLDPVLIHTQLDAAGFDSIRETYLTPRYSEDFLRTWWNRALARPVYLGGKVSRSRHWQTFFLTSAVKPGGGAPAGMIS